MIINSDRLRKAILLAFAGCAISGFSGPLAASGAYYLVAANPSWPPDSYASILYRIGDGGEALEFVRTLTTQRQGAEFVRVYDDAGLILVGSHGSPHRVQFDVVQYEDPARVHQIEADAAPKDLFPATSLFHSTKLGAVIGTIDSSGVYGSSADPFKATLRGLALDGKAATLTWADQMDVITPGYVLGSMSRGLTPDYGPSFAMLDGKFSMGYPGGVMPANLPEPDLSGLKSKNGIVELINNAEIRVLSSYEMNRTERDENVSDYLVLVKPATAWTKLTVAGNRTSVTAFGSRIAFVIGYDAKTYKGKSWPIGNLSNEYYAGLGERMPDTARSGHVVLIDARDHTRVEFDVDSADVDVLRVDGSDVLYRVGPSIFLRDWTTGKLGEPRKLLTDHAVGPAIHWAFKAPR